GAPARPGARHRRAVAGRPGARPPDGEPAARVRLLDRARRRPRAPGPPAPGARLGAHRVVRVHLAGDAAGLAQHGAVGGRDARRDRAGAAAALPLATGLMRPPAPDT